jgi:hypothetical protein
MSQLTGLGVIFDVQSEELIIAALSVLTDLAQVTTLVDTIASYCRTKEKRRRAY